MTAAERNVRALQVAIQGLVGLAALSLIIQLAEMIAGELTTRWVR